MQGKRDNKIVEWFYRILRFFKPLPWPDLTKEKIEMATFNYRMKDGRINMVETAIFIDIPPNIAVRNGWMTYENYANYSNLEYARRYPLHRVSKFFKKRFGFNNEQIRLISKYGPYSKEANDYLKKHPPKET